MPHMFRISEAGSLALHTMGLLAVNNDRIFSTRDIASSLSASEAHLSKVLQRLTKGGFVTPTRGPAGGFRIAKSTKKVTLLQIYELIEGPLETGKCLFEKPVCSSIACIFGDLIKSTNEHAREYLSKTKLSDIASRCSFKASVPEGGRSG